MHVDAPAQSDDLESGVAVGDGLDSLPSVGLDAAAQPRPPGDPAQPECLGSPGIVKRGRGRPRKLVAGNGSGSGGDSAAHGVRESATGWLGAVQAQLEKQDGLTDGSLPVRLAKAVAEKADSMPVLDVVAAFEKCENMALKLKAAKFLKDTSKGTIEELRQYAAKLMSDDEPDLQS